MKHVERHRVLRDTVIITAITAALLAALPLAAFAGLALQLAVGIALPVALLGALVVALFLRSRPAKEESLTVRGVKLQQGVYYHERHAWARAWARGRIRAGVDDLARRALTGVDRVALPEVGARIQQGEVLATLGSGSRAIEVKAPFTGMVTAVNSAAREDPALIVREPYDAGWLVEMKPADGIRALDNLRDAGSARYWIQREVDRLLVLVSGARSVVPALADGGEVMDGYGAALDDDSWRQVTEALF